ncbi:MAG: AzlC family ABC transporter permease [Enterocloster clostridioformis]
MLMSFFIFAGSMEFVTVNLLLSAFKSSIRIFPNIDGKCSSSILWALHVGKHKNVGWKKPYLIYRMCDESFTINCTVTPPPDIDKALVLLFFVTALNQIYWVCGATLGALLGYVIHFNTKGSSLLVTASLLLSCSSINGKKTKVIVPLILGLAVLWSVCCFLVVNSSYYRRWL